MKKLLFATNNESKINIFREKLSKHGIKLLSLKDVNITLELEEDGTSAIENALKKAREGYLKTGLPTIGMDDTLYLENIPESKQPGLFVRRVNGKTLTDEEMIKYYTNLVKEYGKKGKINSKWIYGFAIINENGIEKTYSWEKSDFFLVESASKVRNLGYPLNSISIDKKSQKYFSEMKQEEKTVTTYDRVIQFIKENI